MNAIKAAFTKDGKIDLSEAAAEQFKKDHPEAFEILDEQAERLLLCVSEVEKFQRFGKDYQNNPALKVKLRNGETIHPHDFLNDFVSELEQGMSQMSKAETTWKGRKWVSQEHFLERQKAIIEDKQLPVWQKKHALEDLQQRYWFIDHNYIKTALVNDFADQTSAKIKKFGLLPDKSGNGATAKPTPKAQPTKAKEEQETSDANNPPNTASASDKLNTTGKGGVTGVLTTEDVVKSMWG